MRLAVVADTHFGHARWAEDALLQGKSAILEAAQNADALILAGDIFDSANPSLNVLSEFASLLRQVKAPVLAIHGTHEMRPKGFANPVQFLHSAGLLVNIHNNRQKFEREGERVAVVGMGGVPENYAREALKRLSIKPLEAYFNIFVFHQSLAELISSQEEKFVSFEELPGGFDLYVCGHMHKGQSAFGGRLLIPGSTVLTQMRRDEEGAKGYAVYDTRPRKAEFFQIKTRPFHFVSLSFENAQVGEVERQIERKVKEIAANEKEKPIIKIRLEGSLNEGLVQGDISAPKFNGAFVFVENSLESKTLLGRIEALKLLREKKASAVQVGLETLSRRLAECGVEAGGLDELLERLAQGEEVELKRHLTRKKP